MLLMGCVTKVTIYSIKNTMPAKITVTIRTTKAQTLTSISSCVRSRLTWNLGGWLLDNLFLQYRCYEVIGTVLGELAVRTLTLFGRKVFRILAKISVAVIASH